MIRGERTLDVVCFHAPSDVLIPGVASEGKGWKVVRVGAVAEGSGE